MTSSFRLACFAAALLSLAACFNLNQPHGVAGGVAGKLLLQELAWGRLVDVVDSSNALIQEDVLVRPDLSIDGINYAMSVNPVTEVETLQILAASTSTTFSLLLSAAQAGLTVTSVKGPLEPPPYDLIPRNAVLRLKFSDQIDPDSVDASSIQILTGDPATNPVSVRFLIQNDSSTGTGYVLLDPTISGRDSASLGLPTNPVGFPESFDSLADNLKIRIPTQVDLLFGQAKVVTNLSGSRSFEVDSDDPFEIAADGSSVGVRVARTGNDQDLNRGFLEDLLRPGLIGEIAVTLDTVVDNGVSGERDFIYTVDAAHCAALVPKLGDVFDVTSTVSVVTQVQSSSSPFRVQVRFLEGSLSAGTSLATGGTLSTRYTAVDSAFQLCYVDIDPAPSFVAGVVTDLDPSATFRVRFSEAMDPRTVLSLHSMVLSAVESDEASFNQDVLYFRHENVPSLTGESVADFIDRQRGYDLIVGATGTSVNSEFGGRFLFGPVQPDADSRTFTLSPVLGLADPNGNAFLGFSLALRDGLDGILDLSGNPLDFTGFVAGTPLPTVAPEAQLTCSSPMSSQYLALRALGVDENGDGLAEYAGQFDYTTGRLTGREALLFSVNADSSNQFIGSQQSIPSAAVPAATPPFEPLTAAGSVVMTTYRPHDMGFGYGNPEEYNLDVVGMSWAPMGGLVVDDAMTRFSLAFAHAKYMPDEVVDITGLPIFPTSGLLLSGDFDNNILGFDQKDGNGQPLYDETIVYDGSYVLRAINLFTAPSGVNMLGFPAFSTAYTWRDTTIPPSVTGAAPLSAGSPPSLYGAPIYGPEMAPSIALPLLARFRNYPLGGQLSLNTFQVSQMVAASQLPAFRVFSAGGADAAGNWNLVIPENANAGGTQPIGGYNANGAKTPAFDPFVYWAEIDFSTTVSRVFTHWFDLGAALPADGAGGIVVEPALAYQEAGSSVVVELRGAALVIHGSAPDLNPSPLTTAAFNFDDFGEFLPSGTNGGVSTPSDWTTDFSTLEAQQFRFIQLRFTLLSNSSAGLEAELDGLGLAWDATPNP